MILAAPNVRRNAPRAYYNEYEPGAAHVLRHLVKTGVLMDGEVDDRSIKDVQPDEIRGFTQHHFFCGGGIWPLAATIAGWPEERPFATGSCPCQPFSAAGKGLGTDDPRHLWPDFFRLIRALRFPVIMGEQVAGAPGYGWFDGVAADLESEDYACRTVDIPACAVDAPHVRQRLYWCATLGRPAAEWADTPIIPTARLLARSRFSAPDSRRPLGYCLGAGLEGHAGHGDLDGGRAQPARPVAEADGSLRSDLTLADADSGGRAGRADLALGRPEGRVADEPHPHHDGGRDGAVADADLAVGRIADVEPAGKLPDYEQDPRTRLGAGSRDEIRLNGSWYADAWWIACTDGKARRAKPGIRFLVDGLPGRVGLWRIGGNAIVLPLAVETIKALMDVTGNNALTSRRYIPDDAEIAA